MRPDRRLISGGLVSALAAAAPLARAVAQAAPAASPPAAPAADDPPTQVDTGRDRYEHMLAPVKINGQGPFRFLIDTGANVSCISRDLADRMKLPDAGLISVHSAVGAKDRPSVMLDRLDVGARTRRHVRAPALPSLGKEMDGVLGVDWLAGQRLALDFKGKSLAITRSEDDLTTNGRVVVPARRRLGQLTIVDADLSGHRISAMVDSGSQVTICNAPLRNLVGQIEHGRKDNQLHMAVKLETLSGEPFSGEMFYLPFLRLGGLQLGDVPTVYAETHTFDIWGLKTTPAIVLGMDLLTQFEAVALDFGRSHVRFDLA